MPFAFTVYEDQGLAVAHCTGLVRESEIHEAIDFSFTVARMPAEIDRVCGVEPTANLRELSAEALHRIQVHMAQKSGGSDGAGPAFRSVLVTPSPFHRPIAELYKAIWDSQHLPEVELWVVRTPEEAVRLLGLSQASALLVHLPPTG